MSRAAASDDAQDRRRRRLAADRRRHRLGTAVAALLALALVGAVVAGLVWWDRQRPIGGTCTATLPDGGSQTLDGEQSDNAALMAAIATHRDLPARATTVAIATALQESKLKNIDHGDRDSVGLFQQRPSQGWGSVDEIMDPVYSTNAFYDMLVEVEGWESAAITDAAQDVQRSAFPEAYAQHETRARAFSSGLTGYSPAAVTCALPELEEGHDPSSTAHLGALTERLRRDFVEIDVRPSADAPGFLFVDAAALPGGDEDPARLSWTIGQWAVASATATDVGTVAVADRVWVRTDGQDAAWREATAEEAALLEGVRPDGRVPDGEVYLR